MERLRPGVAADCACAAAAAKPVAAQSAQVAKPRRVSMVASSLYLVLLSLFVILGTSHLRLFQPLGHASKSIGPRCHSRLIASPIATPPDRHTDVSLPIFLLSLFVILGTSHLRLFQPLGHASKSIGPRCHSRLIASPIATPPDRKSTR